MAIDTGWIECKGKSATRDLWVAPVWEGMPEYGPWRLEDGRDIIGLIQEGRSDELPFDVWFEPVNSGKRERDILWCAGTATLPVSARFLSVLRSLGITGFTTYEIDVRWRGRQGKRGEPIPGYVGLLVTSTSDDLDLRRTHPWPGFSFLARPHVIEALLGAGVDGFDYEKYDPDQYLDALHNP